jgi:hypothetical protein
LEVRGGIEPPIRALQALALPLGERTVLKHQKKVPTHRIATSSLYFLSEDGVGRILTVFVISTS